MFGIPEGGLKLKKNLGSREYRYFSKIIEAHFDLVEKIFRANVSPNSMFLKS